MTSTKATPKDLETMKKKDPRGLLVKDLRRWLHSRDRAKKLVEGLAPFIYKASYEWITYTMMTEANTDLGAAIKRLADTLHKTAHSVEGWYYRGRFMHANKLDPKKVRATAICLAYSNWSAISKREQALMIHSLRAEGTRSAITAILQRSKMYSKRQAVRKIADLERKGLFNVTHMKMEAMALQTFASHFYGRDVRITIAANGSTLMELK